MLSTSVRVVDIGINLTDNMYQGKYHGKKKHPADLEEVVRRGTAVGVSGLIITGTDASDSAAAIKLSALCSAAYGCPSYCTVGCHPTRCTEFLSNPEAYMKRLADLIEQHSVNRGGVVAAVGEIGLDFDRLQFCPRDVQEVYFKEQLQLAVKFDLPVFLHDRASDGRFFSIISEFASSLKGGVVHSFTGTEDELRKYLDLGFFIGVNGCSLKTESNLEIVKRIPLNRVLIETDGPWCEMKNSHASTALLKAQPTSFSRDKLSAFSKCAPEKFTAGSLVKGRCEPCCLVAVLEVLFLLHDDVSSIDELSQIIYTNTLSLFPCLGAQEPK